tara:strand:- start:21 stop:455 length:435 start_codon:yes stop_codon:yes gene_type:complete
METPDIQALIANAVAQAIASQKPAQPDYFAEADELTKKANALRKQAVATLEVCGDEQFEAIRNSVETGIATEATKSVNRKGGVRLSDEQKELKKIAAEEHKTRINRAEFKADMSALVGAEETELISFKQSLPSKEGKVKRTLTF